MQAQRQGEAQEVARLQAQAFEAINDAVRSASADTLPLVAQLIPLMLSKLGSTFQAPANSADERERQSELQVQNRDHMRAPRTFSIPFPFNSITTKRSFQQQALRATQG